ncbi:MAG TPA: MFS transporter [Terriglobales bacterium]|nr:MFS transporter [Terriglobales bacterium]
MTANKRIVLAGAIGNVVEWYDFGLYGLLAPVLASQFFPSHDRIAALLGVYGGFAVGFAVRPVGAVVLGRVGDRRGRKFVLVLSVVLMGAATVGIGVLPSYAAIGIGAPILLILIRLFQGFSVGGEFVGSVTYLVETAPANRRGLAGSVANIGATIGMLIAAGAAALTAAQADVHELWRLAFFFGGVLALVGYVLRRHLPREELEIEAERDLSRTVTGKPTLRDAAVMTPRSSRFGAFVARWPALQAFREVPQTMWVALLFTGGYGVSNYVIMIFLPTFAREFSNVNEAAALQINTIGQALVLFVAPFAGWASDRFLRRRTMLALAFAAQAAVSWISFRVVAHSGVAGLWIAQLVLAALLAVVMGTAPAMLAEQFPRGYRVSGHAFVLNVGIGIAGGTAPMIAVALIDATGSRMAPAAYLIAGCALSAVAVLFLRDRSRTTLDDDPAHLQSHAQTFADV